MTQVQAKTLPDEELARRAAGGDRDAFTELARRHGDRMARLATRYLHREADVQDAVQDAFLNAWRHAPRFRGDAAFTSWLHRITANACLMTLRRTKRRPEHPLGDIAIELASDPSQLPDALLANRQLSHALRTAIDDLPDNYRDVFVRADLHHQTMREIADGTGLTVANVKTRLHRARRVLRQALHDHLAAQPLAS